jgi:hypothetical protein
VERQTAEAKNITDPHATAPVHAGQLAESGTPESEQGCVLFFVCCVPVIHCFRPFLRLKAWV